MSPRQVKVEVTIAPTQGDGGQQQHQTLIGLSAGFGASLPATAAAALNLTVAAASPALACPANHSDASGVRRDEQVSVALPARPHVCVGLWSMGGWILGVPVCLVLRVL